jgi:hypothetical protein
MTWNNCEAAISGDGTARALGYNRAHGNALRSLQCANGLQPGGKLLVRRASTRSDADWERRLSLPRLSFEELELSSDEDRRGFPEMTNRRQSLTKM